MHFHITKQKSRAGNEKCSEYLRKETIGDTSYKHNVPAAENDKLFTRTCSLQFAIPTNRQI